MTPRLAFPLLLVLLCGCPDGSDPEPGSATESAALDDAALGQLLERAASMRLQIWELCKQAVTAPLLTEFDGEETLTPLILFLPLEEDRTLEGYDWKTPQRPSPYDATSALERCKQAGYVSVLQAADITGLSSDWKADRADGRVEWTTPELWRGKADFTLERVEGEWRVTRFAVAGVGTVERFGEQWFVVEPRLYRMPGAAAPPGDSGEDPQPNAKTPEDE